MLDVERVGRYLERGTIEIAPIAFMRGRTLNDSFVILDEAQNTTSEQMKMFLTRLGFGSKAVITGDITQIDLPPGRTSGLVEAIKVVGGIEGISFIHFDDRDVVRHKLVQQIVRAYEAQANVANGRRRCPDRGRLGAPGRRRASPPVLSAMNSGDPASRRRPLSARLVPRLRVEVVDAPGPASARVRTRALARRPGAAEGARHRHRRARERYAASAGSTASTAQRTLQPTSSAFPPVPNP